MQADYLSGMVCLLKGEYDRAVTVFSESSRPIPNMLPPTAVAPMPI